MILDSYTVSDWEDITESDGSISSTRYLYTENKIYAFAIYGYISVITATYRYIVVLPFTLNTLFDKFFPSIYESNEAAKFAIDKFLFRYLKMKAFL